MNLINIIRECPIMRHFMNNYADKAILLSTGMIADINGAILCILRDLCINNITIMYEKYVSAVILGAQLESMIIRLKNLTDDQIVHLHSIHGHKGGTLQDYINCYRAYNYVFVSDDSNERIVRANKYIASLRPQIKIEMGNDFVTIDAAWLS